MEYKLAAASKRYPVGIESFVHHMHVSDSRPSARVTAPVAVIVAAAGLAIIITGVSFDLDAAAVPSSILPRPRLLPQPILNPLPLRFDRRHLLREFPHSDSELRVALQDEVIGDLVPAA